MKRTIKEAPALTIIFLDSAASAAFYKSKIKE